MYPKTPLGYKYNITLRVIVGHCRINKTYKAKFAFTITSQDIYDFFNTSPTFLPGERHKGGNYSESHQNTAVSPYRVDFIVQNIGCSNRY